MDSKKIGYKATNNYKCRGQLYEVGQEYKIEGKPILCEKGFHYCIKAKNVLTYYTEQPSFKLLEIEDLSVDTINDTDKSCSNHIKIIREITDLDELMQLLDMSFSYDENARIFKVNRAHGYSYEFTYDENGREIIFKRSDGFSYEYTRNEFGKILTYKNSNEYSYEYTRDKFNKILTYKNSDAYSYEYIYNSDGQKLTYKDSNGYVKEYKYDEFGCEL